MCLCVIPLPFAVCAFVDELPGCVCVQDLREFFIMSAAFLVAVMCKCQGPWFPLPFGVYARVPSQVLVLSVGWGAELRTPIMGMVPWPRAGIHGRTISGWALSCHFESEYCRF